MSQRPVVLVVNCNTNRVMTEQIVAIAESASNQTTKIVGVTPAWGPSSAEGYAESYVTAVATMDAVLSHREHFDAVVMAGYGEHGREGMRQALRQPVVDITEASAYFACLLGRRFGVVTTVPAAVAGIEDSLAVAGVLARCAGVAASKVSVSHIADDQARTFAALETAGRELLLRGADVIVLGCAGFAGLDKALESSLGVPVLDSVACAVQMAHSLVCLDKRTSKVGAFTPMDEAKPWTGRKLGEMPHTP
ncbi:aspartate/glutamate racemase family protein [Microbacterium sp. R86528]|uniref:aspartate/glutamate racemase family protein n=1 Tax=Microbacterium sp. R86528 TaxID=3093864 RepID=UPI0037CA6EEF